MPQQQAILFGSNPEITPVPDDLPALIRRFARKLAGLHGGEPDVPPVPGGAVPAWHYHVGDSAEILERLIGLLSKDTLPSDVVSRRRQRAAAKTLQALIEWDQSPPATTPHGPIDVAGAP